MSDIQGLLDKYSQLGEERFFRDVITNEEYKLAFNEKADVIVDVGALAGEFGTYMYEKARVVYALEPYSKHYEELVQNISEFALTKIKPYKLALSNYNGEGALVISAVRGGHKLVSGGESEKTEKSQVKTLATFMKDEGIGHIDILKIDIENGEDAVFTAPDFAQVAGKIQFIIGEHAGDVVSDALRDNGFFFMDTERGFYARREDAKAA